MRANFDMICDGLVLRCLESGQLLLKGGLWWGRPALRLLCGRHASCCFSDRAEAKAKSA